MRALRSLSLFALILALAPACVRFRPDRADSRVSDGRAHDAPRDAQPLDGGADQGSSDGQPGADLGPPAFSPLPLPAGGDIWTITTHAKAPSTLYVQTAGGRLFRSTNKGSTWSPCAKVGVYVEDVSAAPTAGVVLAGIDDDVMLSLDGCQTWSSTSFGRSAWKVLALSGSSALAVSEGALWRWQSGLWSKVTTPLDGESISVLRAAPGGQRLIVGSSTKGLACSLDGGLSWLACNTGLTSLKIHDIALDAQDPQRLFVATQGGLYRSIDGANNWTFLVAGPIYSVAVNPIDPQLVIGQFAAGALASINGGSSFSGGDRRATSMALARLRHFAVDGDRLYAATARGVFATEPWNWQWTALHAGLETWNIQALATAPTLTLGSTTSGVLRSTTAAPGWVVVSQGFAAGNHSETFDLWLDPADAAQVLVAGEGIFQSSNGGTSYSRIYVTGSADQWRCTAVTRVGSQIYAGTRARLLVSQNGGASFTPHLLNGSPRVVHSLLHDPVAGALLVGTDSGLFVTQDDGQTVSAYMQGLPQPTEVWALAAAPAGGYLAGTSTGLYFSSALGQPWTSRALADSVVAALLVTGQRVVAAGEKGVFVSLDGGATFTELPGLAYRWPQALALDPQGKLLVGTEGYGLHRSIQPLPPAP